VGNDPSKIGVLLLTFTETPQILKQASQYESLYDLVWFWGAPELVLFDPMTRALQAVVNEAPLEAEHVKLFTPMSLKPDSAKYTDLSLRYTEATGETFGIEEACLYDAAWVLAKGVLETGSENASKVASALQNICDNYYGASGWCRLNGFGDRSPPPFEVLFFASGSNSTIGVFFTGIYYPDSRVVNWNTPDNPLGKIRVGFQGIS
jgi:ABC-type branched-subunit amino acid transport system substrate-binding protein